ncbi:MAG TPA: arylesterase [Acidobacteriaceae bacterium]|nr:arylesterase [Acidobacteriaceae bacterium]
MRKVLTTAILAGLLIAVEGCHAGGGTQSPSEAAAGAGIAARVPANSPSDVAPATTEGSAAQADSRPVLVCFGDSLTAGKGTDGGQSYPDYLQGDLDKLGYRYRVDNQGVSGDTTKDGLERLPDVMALHPAVVVVEFGGNDGLRGLPIEESRANLDEIVGTLKRAGIHVAIAGITLPPEYGQDYIAKFDETYRLLAKKYDVPMLPFLLKGVYGVPGMMQADETHATAKGNMVVARNVVSLVTPLLKK